MNLSGPKKSDSLLFVVTATMRISEPFVALTRVFSSLSLFLPLSLFVPATDHLDWLSGNKDKFLLVSHVLTLQPASGENRMSNVLSPSLFVLLRTTQGKQGSK